MRLSNFLKGFIDSIDDNEHLLGHMIDYAAAVSLDEYFSLHQHREWPFDSQFFCEIFLILAEFSGHIPAKSS